MDDEALAETYRANNSSQASSADQAQDSSATVAVQVKVCSGKHVLADGGRSAGAMLNLQTRR